MNYLKQNLGFVLFLFLAAQLPANDVVMPGNTPMKTGMTAMPGDTSVTFTVYGNCGMCKHRIEGALAKVDGIHSAEWSPETKLINLSYDTGMISLDDIKKKIAEVGHDTDAYRAQDSVYVNLPGCCQYERPKT